MQRIEAANELAVRQRMSANMTRSFTDADIERSPIRVCAIYFHKTKFSDQTST